MAEVVNLYGEPSSLANNGDLVEQLEELLERARAGSITAMGMAFVNADGSYQRGGLAAINPFR